MTDRDDLIAELAEARAAHEAAEAAAAATRERLHAVVKRAAKPPAEGGLGPSETARHSGFTREHAANIRDGKTSRPSRRPPR